jgi:hypothetical protein
MDEKQNRPQDSDRISKIITISRYHAELLAHYAPIYGSESALIEALVQQLHKRGERARAHRDGGMVDD